MYAEASRNPKIAAALQEADCRARNRLREILITGRQARGLKTDIPIIDGRVEAIISMFQGLPVRALHNPALDEATLTTAFRLALSALQLGD